MNKFKTCVMGSTGLVGQQFIKMLNSHPFFEVVALSSSEKSVGKKYYEAVDYIVGGDIPECAEDILITNLSGEDLIKMGIKIVFSALPSEAAQEIEKVMANEGLYIFSNASACRMYSDVPIIIPEVNPDHLELVNAQPSHGNGFVVTNSNCTTTGLVLGLKPLLNFGLESVTVTTYQALSGAGRRGVASLDIVDNLIPYIRDEEEKIERETKKILGKIGKAGIKNADLKVNASCCRVPTRDGHLESVVVELDEDVDVKTISDTLSSFRGITQEMKLPTAPEVPVIVRTEENRPQPLLDRDAGTPERARGMAVSVGRIRKKGKKVNFFLLVHNTIRGAAGTCILNAELAVMRSYIK
jgi:aspartate-semialdehyde dehydrogenase